MKPDHIPGKVNMHLTQTDADGNVLGWWYLFLPTACVIALVRVA
jgi:hypothetical protein